jgi:hypothetical protein
MLVLIADYGDEVPEVLIGGFADFEAVDAKIKEIEESDDMMEGAEFAVLDSKKHQYWTLAEERWVLLDIFFGPDDEELDDDPDDDLIDGVGFADPGGKSALRAATKDNPRDQSCPNCRKRNVLTRIDVERGYQCDECADRAERGVD